MLRVVGKKRPLGMVHFDTHTDMYDSYYKDSKTRTALTSSAP